VKCAPPRTSQNETAIAIALILAVVTAGLYWPVLGHAFIDLDDDLYVTANPMVLGGWTVRGVAWAWTTGHAGNWHPLTWLSHMTDCSLFGLQPAGHHAMSAFLHAANTVLLFLLLRRMTGAIWRASVVAALFGWHPLHVESVAWVAERKDVLSTLFWLCAIWAYVRYAEEFKVQSSKFKIWFGVSLLFFSLGLMCKPTVITLPFVLLLLDYWPLERFGSGMGTRLMLEKLPFLALSVASSVTTYFVQRGYGYVSEATPLLIRGTNAVLSYGSYLGRMLWPARLAVFYPYATCFSPVQICVCLFVLAAVTWLVLKCRAQRFLAVGWCWYLGTLVPMIGLIQVGSQSSADRYTYIPLIGIFLMIVWGVADLAVKLRLPSWSSGVAAASVLAACAACTELQLGYWTDSGTLFIRALAVTMNNDTAWNSLGIYLLDQGDEESAFRCFTRALSVARDDEAAWHNLGAFYGRHARNEEALRCLTEALRLHKRPATYCDLGVVLKSLHRPSEAAQSFNEALALDSDCIPARMSLADLLSDAGKNDEAALQYRRILQLNPSQVDAHCNLACVLAAQGKTAEAKTQLQQALEIRPSDASAHCDMGNLLMDEGKFIEAAAEYRAALLAKPGSPEIHSNLGAVLALLGRRQQAMEEFNEALRLAPNFTQARERLKALNGQ